MFGTKEKQACALLIIHTLAKFYVSVELSGTACPLCRETTKHDHECPLCLAWSLLSEEQQEQARRNIHALALSIGEAEKRSDTLRGSEERECSKCAVKPLESLDNVQ